MRPQRRKSIDLCPAARPAGRIQPSIQRFTRLGRVSHASCAFVQTFPSSIFRVVFYRFNKNSITPILATLRRNGAIANSQRKSDNPGEFIHSRGSLVETAEKTT